MAAAASPSNHIPLDIISIILIRLPVKSLLRFKCVCRDWYTLINGSLFVQHHLDKSIQSVESDPSLLNESNVFCRDKCLHYRNHLDSTSKLTKLELLLDEYYVRVTDSCNGLVCVFLGPQGFTISNPSTRTFRQVLREPFVKGSVSGIQHGFGYDRQQDDYKIVSMMLEDGGEIWVYSLKADSWRQVSCQHQPPFEKRWYFYESAIICRFGMLHWIVRGSDDAQTLCSLRYDVEHELEHNKMLQIVRFDLSSEELDGDLEFPDAASSEILKYLNLTVLNGCICLSYSAFCDSRDVWIMKEYGIKESWTKLFRVAGNSSPRYPIYCLPSLVSIPGSSQMREKAQLGEDETNTTLVFSK